jgi:hypothetical protein
MWRIVRSEVEISASVGVFSINLSGQCRPFPDDQNIQKGIALSDSISIVNWMEGLKLLRWLRKFCNCFEPWGQTTNMSSTHRSLGNGLYWAESSASFSKCSMKMFLTMGSSNWKMAWLWEYISPRKACLPTGFVCFPQFRRIPRMSPLPSMLDGALA